MGVLLSPPFLSPADQFFFPSLSVSSIFLVCLCVCSAVRVPAEACMQLCASPNEMKTSEIRLIAEPEFCSVESQMMLCLHFLHVLEVQREDGKRFCHSLRPCLDFLSFSRSAVLRSQNFVWSEPDDAVSSISDIVVECRRCC